jgi:hypothetical protein
VSKASRTSKLEQRLGQLEVAFRNRLLAALKRAECGALGLFGHHDLFEESRWLPDAMEGQELVTLGQEIADLRARLGMEQFELLDRFLAYRGQVGPNAPGDSNLALKFLNETDLK